MSNFTLEKLNELKELAEKHNWLDINWIEDKEWLEHEKELIWIISNTEDSLKEKKQKRWDTRIWTIEKKYWIDLWVRSDMKLSNYLDREGFGSLSKIIENR